MADFTPNTNVKSAVRKLAAPIADIEVFNSVVQSVILNNPFGCVSYMSAGVNHPPVEKTKETYTAKFVFEDENVKRVGSSSESYDTKAGFAAGISAVIANTANNAAHGGTPYHDPEGDTFSATVKCHDPTGEMYFLNISRRQVSLSSYEDDSIRARVETWADSVPALE
jgi:predicted RNA methylase